MVSAILFWTYHDFFCTFSSPLYKLVLLAQPPMWLLQLWESLQVFAVLTKAPKRNRLGKKEGFVRF